MVLADGMEDLGKEASKLAVDSVVKVIENTVGKMKMCFIKAVMCNNMVCESNK